MAEKSPGEQRLERAEQAYEDMMLCAAKLREIIEELKKVTELVNGRTHPENPDAPRS